MINWEEKLKEKNIKVIDYMDKDLQYVYDDETETYFSCIDTMEDYYERSGLKMPKYAYGTYFESVKLDLDYILESACEEHAEDVVYDLYGVSELREAIEKFNDINKGVGSYYPSYKTIVKLFID